MRKFIDIINEAVEPAPLDEGKFKNASLAMALSATALGQMATKPASDSPETEQTQSQSDLDHSMFYVYDDEAEALGISGIDEVNPRLNDKDIASRTAASKPVAAKSAKPAKSAKKAPQQKAGMSEPVRLLALTMWGEARSDGPEAMRAVGHVIINRIRSKRKFGKNVKEVVWKRKAFSCWNPSDPNREAMMNIAQLPSKSLERVRWKQAVKIAEQILEGGDKDPTNGALFYHTKAIKPYWVDSTTKPVANINSHLFYRDDAKAKS
jgi:spore germination cell wall hydrolase CwlJ-like protein